MNWRIKAHTLALLSRVPAGRRMYHVLQRVLRTNRLDVDNAVRRSLEVVDLARRGGRDPAGGVVLEVGTGWRPFLPFVLRLVGAERVITLDVNPWLTHRYALETARSLEGQLEVVADRTGVSRESVQRRYAAGMRRTGSLAGLLAGFEVEYFCPGDARQTGLPEQSVDVVCSTNVLEHVPPDALRAIHRESSRILRPGGVAAHRIDPGDHFRLVDPSITGANFLQFSETDWRWYGGSGLGYHNRLRCVQHKRLLTEAGFEALVEQVRMDQAALEAIRGARLRVHPEFAPFTPEELAADHLCIVCRSAGGGAASTRLRAPRPDSSRKSAGIGASRESTHSPDAHTNAGAASPAMEGRIA